MNLEHLATYAPSERKRHWPDDWRGTFRLYRTRKLQITWMAIYLLPLACSSLLYFRTHSFAESLIPLLISAVASLALATSLQQSYIILNIGIFFRQKEPIRYWASNLILALGSFLPAFILMFK